VKLNEISDTIIKDDYDDEFLFGERNIYDTFLDKFFIFRRRIYPWLVDEEMDFLAKKKRMGEKKDLSKVLFSVLNLIFNTYFKHYGVFGDMLLPLEKRISSITKEYNFFANKLNNNLPVLNYFRKIKAFAMRNRFVIKSGGSLHVRKLNFRKIKYKSYHKVNYLRSKFKKFFKYNSLVNQQLLMHYKRPTRNFTIRSLRQFEFLEQNAVKKEKLYMYKTFFFNFFRFSSTDQPTFFKTRPAFLSRNRLLNLKHYIVGQKSFLYNYGLSYRKYLKKNLRKTKISFRR